MPASTQEVEKHLEPQEPAGRKDEIAKERARIVRKIYQRLLQNRHRNKGTKLRRVVA